MTDRVQLNLRLDGRRDLLEAIKEVASAEGLSVNAWVVRTLESATNSAPEPAPNPTPQPIPHTSIPDIEALLDKMLDEKLAAKFPDTADHALINNSLTSEDSAYDELENKYCALKLEHSELLDSGQKMVSKLLASLHSLDADFWSEKRRFEQQVAELQNEIVFKNLQLSELQANKQSAPGVETFPEAAELYNQFKAQNKKSKVGLADIEAVLGLLEEMKHKNLQSSLDNSAEKADR